MQIRNGVGDLKVQTDSAHIMNSPYSIEHMGGMVLYLSNSKFFATEWDDQPITMEVVATLEKKPEVIQDKLVEIEKADLKKEVEQEFLEVNEAVEAKPLEEKETTIDVPKAEPEQKVENSLEDTEELKEESINEKKVPEIETLEAETDIEPVKMEESMETQDNLEDNTQKEVSPVPEEKREEQSMATEKEDEDVMSNGSNPVTLAGMDCNCSRDKEERFEDEVTRKYYRGNNNIRYNRERARQDRREKESQPFFDDHPIAKYMFNNFPRMYPFDDNEVAWCVKIEPQDIGLLPMETWVLGNNSFLLHGYYSYRHLIFARLNDDKQARYILGVPGIYHNRERFMARMFGFENYKSVKRKDRRTGEFGYWYVPILLN